jgi:CMP-N,N'-diacetyllegionaminic acid synthase
MSDILTVVPSRGGSKGLPGKNIKPLGGIPLIGHVLRAARSVPALGDIVLSTDEEAIAEIGRSLGFMVPFLRPAELATDTASSVSVMLHALRVMEDRRGRPYAAALLLQPTCPFTAGHHIEAALSLMLGRDLDFVGSVTRVVDEHPAYMLKLREDGHFAPAFPTFETLTPRQQLPVFFVRCGNIYLTRRSLLVTEQVLIGGASSYVEIDRLDAININDPFDWLLAEARLRQLGSKKA